MDTRRLIIAVSLGLGFLLLYEAMLPWIDRKMHWDQPQVTNAPVETPTSEPSTQATSQPAIAASEPATTQSAVVSNIAPAPAASAVVPATQPFANPVAVSLGSPQHQDGEFAVDLNLSPTGAGVSSVILNQFKETAEGKALYRFESPLPDRLDTAPLSSRSITVDGATYDLAGVQWSLIHSDPTAVTYGAELKENGRTLLSLAKTYRIVPRSDPSEGYEVGVDYAFTNRTDRPQKVSFAFNGPTLPPPEGGRGPDRQVVGGYIVERDVIETEFHPIEEFKPDKNNGEFDLTKDGKGRPVRWAGAVSNYFGAVVLPLDMQVKGAATNPNYIARIVAHGVNIDKEVPIDEHQAYLTFETTQFQLDPGPRGVTLPMKVFVGPKWRKLLDTAYYAAYPREYSLLAIIRTSMCGMSFCTFDWLASPMVWLMGVLHAVFRDWGLAIIGLVAIVRLLLHPITRQSQISMSKMSKMGPEMERLKKKYGDDKEGLNKAMIEFHREQGLGPYLGCLPMFLQMPIWIALYGVLQSTFELRQAPFLWNLTWIHDLSQPDYLVKFAHPVHVLFFDVRGLNLVPVLLSIAMVFQQKLMPKPAAATPEQMQQQKMMQWLSPVMFLFFFYNLPSGLNLYIFTSTAVGVIESKVIRDHLKQKEEAEKAGKVLVETKPTRASRKQGRNNQPNEKPKAKGPMGWLGERWARLLEQAEQVRQDQDRKQNGKKK